MNEHCYAARDSNEKKVSGKKKTLVRINCVTRDCVTHEIFRTFFFVHGPPIRKLSKLPNEMLHVEVRHRHHKNVVVKDQDQFYH